MASTELDLKVGLNSAASKTNSLRNLHLYSGDTGLDVLVVRRGVSFTIELPTGTVSSARILGCQTDEIFYVLATDTPPNFACFSEIDSSHYTVEIFGDTATLTPTVTSPVGRFLLEVKSGAVTEMAELIILFNPYETLDPVYISVASGRAEYVENEETLIWQGLSDNNNAFKWDVDQFDYTALDVACGKNCLLLK